MTSEEIRQKFLDFFEQRGHKIVPSASLIPSTYGDEGTLFTTAGMQPMIPYLLGQPHPGGKRIADVQKCVRTIDIDDVGDNRHNTFFEMLGNWSLGDYFKAESIPWSFDFLTNKEYGLGLDPERFYVTVFCGENGIPRDEESIKIWQEVFAKYGISNEVAGEDGAVKEGVRIIPLGVDDNFWIAGSSGPCGADTEIFYDVHPDTGELSGNFNDLIDSFRLIEVWNNVFMEYNKTLEGLYEPLAAKNVDTGMGLERTTTVVNGKDNIFETDLFIPIISKIEEISKLEYGDKSDSEYIKEGKQCWVDVRKQMRIVSDHLRTAVFMIADGVTPSNTDRGYILRRILRRMVRYSDQLNLTEGSSQEIASLIIEKYKKIYPEIEQNHDRIFDEINKEEEKFRQTLKNGLRIIEGLFKKEEDETKSFSVGRKEIFDLYQTYGFPVELSLEEIDKEKSKRGTPRMDADLRQMYLSYFQDDMKRHQEVSKAGSEQKFKGGLAGTGEMETKYHTATHMLLAALRQVLKGEIVQKGSNITTERLRFDFNWPEKLTPEQVKAVEDLVNEKIQENIPVELLELPKDEATKIVTTLSFDLSKYGDVVKVYKIGDFSAEFCGGPHVENTGALGHFKIAKEEASSAGVRRIKAVLE